MKKSLIVWGRCGLALLAAMAFAASAAPPPTSVQKIEKVNEYYKSSNSNMGVVAAGQVASTRVGTVNITAKTCSPPVGAVDKIVLNCGWGKKMAVLGGAHSGNDKVAAVGIPQMAAMQTYVGNSKINFYLTKTAFVAGPGLRIGSPGITGVDLLKPSFGTATVSAAASIPSSAKDLDPVFGGVIATNAGANIA